MIDVIIPAYNAQNTIEKTLLSINMQTIKEKVKVYIINDNSLDNYDEIYNQFKEKINITLINLCENKGPGNARNVGLNNSSSKYILFLDSDDELYNSLSLELLLNSIKDNDLCVGGVIIEDENYKHEFINNYSSTLHGKLYKREFIMNNNLLFNNSYRSEDNSFHNLLLMLNPKITFVNEPVYFYKYNSNSLTDVEKDLLINDYNFNVSWLVNELERRKVNIDIISNYVYKSYIYNYFIYNNCLKVDTLIDNVRTTILPLLNKYEKYLDEDTKLLAINEYKFNNLNYISFNEFDNLIKNKK